MRASVQASFVTFTEPLEGKVAWMYVDVKQLVTTGIGNLIDPINLALPLPWVHKTSKAAASQAEIKADWDRGQERHDPGEEGAPRVRGDHRAAPDR